MCRSAARETSRLSAPARRGRHAAAVGSASSLCVVSTGANAALAERSCWDTRGTVGHPWHSGTKVAQGKHAWHSELPREAGGCGGGAGDYVGRDAGRLISPADGTFSAGQLYVPAAARADSATAGTSVRPESTTRAGAAGEGP